MDFFAQQTRVRRRSRLLVLLFVLAVAGIVLAVNLLALAFFGFRADAGGSYEQGLGLQDLLALSISVLAVIGLATLYRMHTLRGGGASVAKALGATFVPPDTTDPAWRRLRNIIEEVAIASGVNMPAVYVMENEMGINAFAAGYSPADAAVCVTRGCLDRLDRDELQGVIAHEFSHVLNGDMRLNIRLMGLLFGIMVLTLIGRFMLYSGGRVRGRNGKTAVVAIMGMALMAVGYVGYLGARLIQAAVSRSRESLADASAVQFTRQTKGLAGALMKIAALQQGSRLVAPNRQEVAHMLFGEAGGFNRWLATHPPLPRRLQDIGVAWDPQKVTALAQSLHAADHSPHAPSAAAVGFASASSPTRKPTGTRAHGYASAAVTTGARKPIAGVWAVPGQVASARVGQPSVAAFDLASVLQDELPSALRAMTRTAQGARCLLMALVLDRDPGIRQRQLVLMQQADGGNICQDVQAAYQWVAQLRTIQRLPLATVALPALQQLPPVALTSFMHQIKRLAYADNRIDLHEYCLLRMLETHIDDFQHPARQRAYPRGRLHDCTDSFSTVCVIVASHGGKRSGDVPRQAYMQAMHQTLPDVEPAYVMPDDWQSALDDALHKLRNLRLVDKQRVIDGLATVISADGVVHVDEAELLRVVCTLLQCPLPLLQAQPASDADA